MWLINTETLDLHFTLSPDRYAILSHRWEDEEITFQDMHTSPRPVHKKGYLKIVQFCERAKTESYEWVWVDTCCIDKTNSTELSEAINSMYRWYYNAGVCYAYLSDVSGTGVPDKNRLLGSLWFTRGWTLQELLAPPNVVFYNVQWRPIATRSSLAEDISKWTKIKREVLYDRTLIQQQSVAARMSWAAGRRVTRIEDRAYSLIGIFGVNMPMLYGEGERAFIRLQEEIIKYSDDETIFCWATSDMNLYGLLATDPDAFGRSSEIVPWLSNDESEVYALTNRGIRMRARVIPHTSMLDTCIVEMRCTVGQEADRCENGYGILLRYLERDGQYLRVGTTVSGTPYFTNQMMRQMVASVPRSQFAVRTIYVRQPQTYPIADIRGTYGFQLGEKMLNANKEGDLTTRVTVHGNKWDERTGIWSTTSKWREPSVLEVPKLAQDGETQSCRNPLPYIVLGFDEYFHPICILNQHFDAAESEDIASASGSIPRDCDQAQPSRLIYENRRVLSFQALNNSSTKISEKPTPAIVRNMKMSKSLPTRSKSTETTQWPQIKLRAHRNHGGEFGIRLEKSGAPHQNLVLQFKKGPCRRSSAHSGGHDRIWHFDMYLAQALWS